MTEFDWSHFLVFSSLGLNLLICGVLTIVWYRTKDYGKQHYVVKDKPGVVYVVRETFNGPIRYIGITSNLDRRKAEHRRRATLNTPFYKWLGDLYSRGMEPVFDIVQECPDRRNLAKAEREWIAKFATTGTLLNSTNGG